MDIKKEIADMKGIPTIEVLNEQLRKEVLQVTFLKLDGDKRIMDCTKSYDVIPEEHKPKTDKQSKEGTVTVWDVNAKGWRSFRYDRVQEVGSVPPASDN
jgi:hypothetical protein